MAVLFEGFTRELSSLENVTSSRLQDGIELVTTWEDRLMGEVTASVEALIHSWLIDHPLLNWLVCHPGIGLLIILIVIVLLIRLLVTIYRSIVVTIDRLWLAILRSPFWLVKLLFGWEMKPQNNLTGTNITNYEVTTNPEQLSLIMARLEQIQRQQQQIIQDIARLKQQGIDIHPQAVGLTDIKQLQSQSELSSQKAIE